jgi:cytochrome c oxidase subunit 2
LLGHQSALNPHGPAAREIADLAWLLFAGGSVIFVFVIATVAMALYGPPRLRAWLGGTRVIVAGGIAFPIVVLTALLLRAFVPEGFAQAAQPAVQVEVVAEQWWWRVHYVDAAGDQDFATANEIRIPVGATVEIALRSADVIHSFWVPSLAGKIDMFPGRVNTLRLSADRPGVFRGQCAEYCGGPHARMALLVIALPEESFEAWRAQQRTPAVAPATGERMRGQALFAARGCGVCHAIRGTAANGVRGPDLTHVGGRLSLGAGTLANGAGPLALWVAAGQQLKPGNLMPSYDFLPDDDRRALAAYLEGLQ